MAAVGGADYRIVSESNIGSQIVHFQPRRVRPVSAEAQATRQTEFRLAHQSHVGPHHGPGSGAPLNFMISKMKGTLERLETFEDESASDDSEGY